jgi:NAD(P)-dependent dehydrogenase (short-subunit alcohol dehydrogenase family)
MTPLAEQSILITGAAHGIGAEVARRLAAHGARISLVGLGGEELRRVAADCPGAVVFDADVTDHDALDAAVAGTVEAFGGIDTVFANAGIGAPGFIRTMDPASFERIIEVNLIGVWRTIRACLPHVIERRGYVLPVASMAALLPPVGLAAYGAAKSGVEALGHALRVETQGYGVAVGVAYFSWIDTEMVRGADRTELGATMRAGLRGPLARHYPVSAAAEAVVRGIERRQRIVACPRGLLTT